MPDRTSSRRSPFLTFLGAAVAAVLLALLTAVPAQARSCKTPRYPGSGYFTSLKVTKVSCATGRRITLAHHRCRTRNGKAGRCRSRVRRYRCTERRTTISTEINGIVTCRRGARKVVYSYQQNT